MFDFDKVAHVKYTYKTYSIQMVREDAAFIMISDKVYAQFLQSFMHAARKAGEGILQVYNSDKFDVQLKGDDSPLTLADTASHRDIQQTLAEAFPTIPLLSEEGKHIPYRIRKRWKTYFCVDPLDGTKEFISKNGEFTVNIALIEKRKPVLGVIYIPWQDTLYFGGADTGSYKIDRFSKVFSYCDSLSSVYKQYVSLPCADSERPFTVVGSRSHLSEETRLFIDELGANHENLKMISAGSSMKFCLIAEGIADVYPRFAPTMEWDTAAGQAIVEGVGGKTISSENKKRLKYNKKDLVNPWFMVLFEQKRK
jgi:3'(2'), 5'-bisphosphate nucleotidase